MKIITLHQPWASLVSLGLKGFETRHWSTDYRGSLLIHAAARKPDFDIVSGLCDDFQEIARAVQVIDGDPPAYTKCTSPNLPLGCIVAIAKLVDCRRMVSDFNYPRDVAVYRECRIAISDQTVLERAVGLWQSGRYALKLENVRKLEPIPFKSRQGMLLPAPSEIIAQVNQQLQEVCNAT